MRNGVGQVPALFTRISMGRGLGLPDGFIHRILIRDIHAECVDSKPCPEKHNKDQ